MFLLRTYAQEVKQSVFVVVVDTKIAKSGGLGTCQWTSLVSVHNQSTEFGEKLASVCLELSGKAYK